MRFTLPPASGRCGESELMGPVCGKDGRCQLQDVQTDRPLTWEQSCLLPGPRCVPQPHPGFLPGSVSKTWLETYPRQTFPWLHASSFLLLKRSGAGKMTCPGGFSECWGAPLKKMRTLRVILLGLLDDPKVHVYFPGVSLGTLLWTDTDPVHTHWLGQYHLPSPFSWDKLNGECSVSNLAFLFILGL